MVYQNKLPSTLWNIPERTIEQKQNTLYHELHGWAYSLVIWFLEFLEESQDVTEKETLGELKKATILLSYNLKIAKTLRSEILELLQSYALLENRKQFLKNEDLSEFDQRLIMLRDSYGDDVSLGFARENERLFIAIRFGKEENASDG